MAKLQTLQENWNSGAISAALWANQFGIVSVSGSALNISSALNTIGFSGIDSLNSYDLTGSYFSVLLSNGGNQALANWSVWPCQVFLDSNNQLKWQIIAGIAHAYKKVGGVETEVGTGFSYDSTNHKYFRIRELNGTIYWDYSPDGIGWTNYQSLANPFAITVVTVEMSCGDFANNEAATTAIIDNINYFPRNTARIYTVQGFQ